MSRETKTKSSCLQLIIWPIDWLIDRLIEWWNKWEAAGLTDWLDWLTDSPTHPLSRYWRQWPSLSRWNSRGSVDRPARCDSTTQRHTIFWSSECTVISGKKNMSSWNRLWLAEWRSAALGSAKLSLFLASVSVTDGSNTIVSRYFSYCFCCRKL